MSGDREAAAKAAAKAALEAAKAEKRRDARRLPLELGGGRYTKWRNRVVDTERHVLKELGFTMLLQIHDELLFEVEKDKAPALRALVREAMQEAHPLRVPLLVQVKQGDSWGTLETVEEVEMAASQVAAA